MHLILQLNSELLTVEDKSSAFGDDYLQVFKCIGEAIISDDDDFDDDDFDFNETSNCCYKTIIRILSSNEDIDTQKIKLPTADHIKSIIEK